jgi:hypothetical protein
MEGPLLVLKSWLLTALAIGVYRRWFQRVAPATPEFEAFCAKQPVVAVLFGLAGNEQRALALLASKLGKRAQSVATLGGFPWPHYRLGLGIETRQSAVLLRVTRAEVVRTRDRDLPALASVVREVLNELPEGAQAWLHAGTFNNGLVAVPPGGWALERGTEKRPRLRALQETPAACAGNPGSHFRPSCEAAGRTAFSDPLWLRGPRWLSIRYRHEGSGQ